FQAEDGIRHFHVTGVQTCALPSHASRTEPWDGPAAIAACDGIYLLAGMDRNGLRPARWTITPDVLIVSSEAGICPEEESRAMATGQLGPGEVILFDGRTGEIRHSDDVKQALATELPYDEWVNTETLKISAPFDSERDTRFHAEALARVFDYTAEERRLVLAPMAQATTPVGSMGDDTGLAVLSGHPRRLTRYFHQMFAQVTNPPVDPIRERLAMSLRIQLGKRGPILEDFPSQAHLIELSSPIISDAELEAIVRSGDRRLFSHWISTTWPVSEGPAGMRKRIDEICAEAADVSIVVVSGEPRDAHDIATLVAFGCSAVNPYLAIDQVIELAGSDEIEADPVTAQENFRRSLEYGLLSVMSKMGICTVSGYRGSELFEVIGLSEKVCRRAFRNAPRRLRGIGFEEIAGRTQALHSRYREDVIRSGGFYKHRRGEEFHITGPKIVLDLQKSVRSGETDAWE